MAFPLASVVTALSFDTVPVERRGGAYGADGIWSPSGSPTLFSVPASVSPARSADLQRVPEGRGTRGVIRLILTTQLQPGDRVTWRGVVWEVGVVDDWTVVGGFWDCLATKETT